MRFFVLVISVLLAGCSSLPGQFELAKSEQQIVFPSPPEVARLAYRGTIIGESNIARNEQAKTAIQKIARAIIGLNWFEEELDNLLRPLAITGWPGEDLYIVDAGNDSILKIDIENASVDWITAAGKMQKFVSPVSIAKLGDKFLAVSDSVLGYVAILDRDGNWVRNIGEGLLDWPVGIVVDPQTFDIYVADSKADNIKVFTFDGMLIDIIGASGIGKGQFNGPTHMAIKYPWLAVSDTLNGRVQLINLETEEQRIIGERGLFIGNFVRPKGLAFDSDYNLYTLESYYDYLLIFNIEGDFLLAVGGSGQQHGQFNLPSGLYIDELDTIFITDMLNGRVELFQFLGD